MSKERTWYLIANIVFTPVIAVVVGPSHFMIVSTVIVGFIPIAWKDRKEQGGLFISYAKVLADAFMVGVLFAPSIAAWLLAWRLFAPHDAYPFNMFLLNWLSFESELIYITFFGIGSLGYAIYMVIYSGVWRLRQHAQPFNLPTSKAASAAIGLAELEGVARAVDPAHPSNRPLLRLEILGEPGTAPVQDLAPFYLEDKSGRILVDPRGAEIRPSYNPNVDIDTREIVLTKRIERVTTTAPEVRVLLPGNPVYLIGRVTERDSVSSEAVGSERLVVKPLVRPRSASNRVKRLAMGSAPRNARDLQYVFLLTDTDERGARQAVRSGLGKILLQAGMYGAAGIWMVMACGAKLLEGYDAYTPAEIWHIADDLNAEQMADYMIRYAETNKGGARAAAIDRLGVLRRGTILPPLELPHKEAFDHRILPFVFDEHELVRQRARAYLKDGNFGPIDHELGPLFERAATHFDWRTQYFALVHLKGAGIEDEIAIPLIVAGLREPNIRWAAAGTLRSYPAGTNQYAPLLFEALDAEQDHHRERFSNVLTKLSLDPAIAIPLCRTYLNGDHKERRDTALLVASNLKEKGQALVTDIEPLLQTTSRGDATKTITALHQVRGDPAATVRDVLALFERDDTSWDPDEDYDFTRELVDLLHDCKAHAAPAVPMYMRWIEQNKNTKRAIDALYHVGPKAAAAMPLLLPLLEPSEHTLSVIHALQGLGPKAAPAAKRLGEMVAGIRLPEKGNPRHDALEALTAMGEAAHPALGHLFTAAQYDGEHSVAEPTVNLIVTLGKKDPRLRTWLVGFFSESKETELSLASFNAMSTTGPQAGVYLATIRAFLGDSNNRNYKRPIAIKELARLTAPPRPAQPNDEPLIAFAFEDALDSEGPCSTTPPQDTGVYVDGPHGRALHLNGKTELRFECKPAVVLGHAFTVSFRMKARPSPNLYNIVRAGPIRIQVQQYDWIPGYTLWTKIEIRGERWLSRAPPNHRPFVKDKWQRVSIVHDNHARTIATWLDGKKVMERPNFDTNAWDAVILAEKNLDTIILGDGAAETSPADIDELKIYDYARSAEQLAVEVRP